MSVYTYKGTLVVPSRKPVFHLYKCCTHSGCRLFDFGLLQWIAHAKNRYSKVQLAFGFWRKNYTIDTLPQPPFVRIISLRPFYKVQKRQNLKFRNVIFSVPAEQFLIYMVSWHQVWNFDRIVISEIWYSISWHWWCFVWHFSQNGLISFHHNFRRKLLQFQLTIPTWSAGTTFRIVRQNFNWTNFL